MTGGDILPVRLAFGFFQLLLSDSLASCNSKSDKYIRVLAVAV